MDSLEEEMSRFEQEVLGVTSSKPRPLMNNNNPTPLMPPTQQKTADTAPRPLFTPTLEPVPKPLMAPSQSGFVPRQALNKPPIRPLMGPGGSGGPPPPQVLPRGLSGGLPGIPRPPISGHIGPPPGGASGFTSFPPPVQRMSAPPGQPPPVFPPPPRPPPPQLHSFPPSMQVHTGSGTPLNPMAIAQAVAGATGSSGMSAHSMTMGSSGGASLLPAPTMPPKKALVGKVKSDPKKLRMGGGKVWEDHTLDDWDQNDFRIFVGDIGNDVNDDTLARSFSRFPSFLKAKVIRDRYSKKTKGYGFVSFKEPKDFMNAMREMNGKYIGNRPVKLRKSTWKDRQLLVVKKKEKEKKRLGFK